MSFAFIAALSWPSDSAEPVLNNSTSFEYRSAWPPARSLRNEATAAASTLSKRTALRRGGRQLDHLCGDFGPLREPFPKQPTAFLQRVRLGQNVVHVGAQTLVAINSSVVRSQRDDRRALALAPPLTDQFCRRESVHVRHVQIHENQVEVLAGAARDGLVAALHPHAGATERCEIALGDSRIDRLVLHQQHVALEHRRVRRPASVTIQSAPARLRSTIASASRKAIRCTGLRTIIFSSNIARRSCDSTSAWVAMTMRPGHDDRVGQQMLQVVRVRAGIEHR